MLQRVPLEGKVTPSTWILFFSIYYVYFIIQAKLDLFGSPSEEVYPSLDQRRAI